MHWDRKVAIVDLETRHISVSQVPEALSKRFLGGRGIDEYLLYNFRTADNLPLHSTDCIFLSIGLLSGTPTPGGDKVFVSGKMPKSNFMKTCSLNGPIASELQRAGIEHLVVHGRPAHPVFLWIHDGEIEIHDASHIWSLEKQEVETIIQDLFQDDELQLLYLARNDENVFQGENTWATRPSSENQCNISWVSYFLGWKDIKAIAVRGTQTIEIACPHKSINQLINMEELLDTSNRVNNIASIINKTFHVPRIHDSKNDFHSNLYNIECFNAVLDALGAGYLNM